MRGEEGVAALELALLLPLLAFIFVAMVDASRFATQVYRGHMIAQSAAVALGTSLHVPAPPLPVITDRGTLPATLDIMLPKVDVASLVPLPADASASSLLFWGCPGSAGIVMVALPICNTTQRAAAYAEITVTLPVRKLGGWPEILLPGNVHAQALVRVG